MFETLHASHNGSLYRAHLRDFGDIAHVVGEHRLDTISTRDNEVVFWFTPSTHCSRMQVNMRATQLLLLTAALTPRRVPLLRGNIVITGNDGCGNPAGLTAEQMYRLTTREPSSTQQCILDWRVTRDQRARRRARRLPEPTYLDGIMRSRR
jgi:hypothetical protein